MRVNVIGDRGFEGAETFKLNATNANGVTTQGTGTIRDDGVGDNMTCRLVHHKKILSSQLPHFLHSLGGSAAGKRRQPLLE